MNLKTLMLTVIKMDFVNVLAVITQFNSKLDELNHSQGDIKETLKKLQRIMDLVMSKIEDWSNKFGELDQLGVVQRRLGQMVIDDEKEASCPPST